MEQVLTGDIWKEVNDFFIKGQSKIACISYVTSNGLNLSKGDTLVCDASEYEIRFGSTSATALEAYFKRGVTIYSNRNLHSKLVLTESFLVIGSANLSHKSAKDLVEAAVVTDNDILLSQTKSFCHILIEEEETFLLTREHISDLLKIKVVKQPFKPTAKSRTFKERFGKRYWYVPLDSLSDRAYEKIRVKTEGTKKEVATATKISKDYIGTIYWKGKTTFTSLAREGDQIMMNWRNENKTRRYIFPFSTILRIDKENDETMFYYDNTTEGDERSLSKFLSMIKDLDLEKSLDKPRTKELSAKDATKLKALWK